MPDSDPLQKTPSTDDSDPLQTRPSDAAIDSRAPPHADLALPETIGRYRVEKILGEGGFGRMYLALDEQLKRRVAIKVPHAKLISREEDAQAYQTEAQTLASLDHPRIVPVYDVGSTDEFPCYVVSKYVTGDDLAKRLANECLSCGAAAELVATVAEALHYAHKQGLVHRDVKPGNILLDDDRTPYLVDFGLALRDTDVGKGGHFAGTPAYMSPEQARGEGHRVDGRSDIYSLGAVLYELLVSRPPFAADTLSELLEQVAKHDPKPPRQLHDTVPKELERICLKSLSKRAADRYTTAKDMAEDLQHFLAEHHPPSVAVPSVGPLPVGIDSTKAKADSDTARAYSDSDRIKIVPKGLRSFDRHDADFFLELLPGPRDREGLPDSLRFWKTRIEETDADNTFSVGLIYGPSGCGKSSLVKAGLLPRLSTDVISFYVEATAEETETGLLNGLRRRCPVLSEDLDLTRALATLRRGQGIPVGKKVLIVLDQFEQWLHARSDKDDTELVQALRQCDGGRVQCIVMVRDDFWMAVTRFLRALEIRLLEGHNLAAVDLFPERHARNVLAAFGRAFGALTETGKTSQDEHDFLNRSIAGLAEEGKVICVNLALFAEMMKGKLWTTAALKEVGGTQGVGATFLEETFSSPTASPEHRYHQQAAREVLKTLLPDSGTDIKGHMRTRDELLEASGYARRLDDFDGLIKMLDSDIRLITPTDPEGVESNNDSESHAERGQKYYQLTHDYLVPSLRDWLTRKQKETRRGRAELRLAELAALWNAKPENRHLPTLWEYCNIRFLAERKNWIEPQRRMMAKAGRIHCIRWGNSLLVALVIGVTIQQMVAAAWRRHLSEQVHTKVASLNTSRGIILPPLKDLDDFPREMVLSKLQEQFPNADEFRKLPLAYALARFGDMRIEFLVSRIESASPHEFDNFLAALGKSKGEAISALEAAARAADSEQSWQHKARLAMLALHLRAPSLAKTMCQLRPDPVQRTLFIEECSTWHGGDESALAEFVATSDDGPFRSGVALAVGSMGIADVTIPEKRQWETVLSKWYTTEPDALTHSAAGWALRQWRLKLPEIVRPVENPNWHVNSVGMTMLKVPDGTFVRKDREDKDAVEKKVTLSRSFLLADREVSRAQFQQFIDDPEHPDAEKPKDWPGALTEYSPSPQHPVQSVSWYDAILFCNWLSDQEGLMPCYERTGEKEKGRDQEYDVWRVMADANGYRLPTKAEWEYACRAGTVTVFSHADEESLLDRYAVVASAQAELAGSKLPNGWGLFDMHGSIWEWCQDWYAPYGKEDVTDPQGNENVKGQRMLRGGSFLHGAREARSAHRHDDRPDDRNSYVGFRVARTLAP